MFIAINRLHVKSGREDELEQRFSASHGLDHSPGFLHFQLLKQVWKPGPQDEDNAIEYLAMTQWTTKQAFTDWTRSDAFKQAHANPRSDMFAAPGEPAGYTIAVEREA